MKGEVLLEHYRHVLDFLLTQQGSADLNSMIDVIFEAMSD